MKRHPDEKIIYALFESPEEMERVLDVLLAAGISIEDISLLVSEEVSDKDFAPLLEKHRTAQGAAAGSILGGTIGSIVTGMLAASAAVAGQLGILVLGPAVALAAAGGLLGGLFGHSLPAEESKYLQDALSQGKAMMAVHTHKPVEIEIARAVLKKRARDGLVEAVASTA